MCLENARVCYSADMRTRRVHEHTSDPVRTSSKKGRWRAAKRWIRGPEGISRNYKLIACSLRVLLLGITLPPTRSPTIVDLASTDRKAEEFNSSNFFKKRAFNRSSDRSGKTNDRFKKKNHQVNDVSQIRVNILVGGSTSVTFSNGSLRNYFS